MSIKPPFTAVEVRRAASGFYQGHSVEIALLSKGIMIALVIWALVWPANANGTLGSLNWALLEGFNSFYIIIVGLFAFSSRSLRSFHRQENDAWAARANRPSFPTSPGSR